MSKYSLTHLGDHELLRDVRALVDHDRAATALLVAHLAEVDARRLYLPAAHPSMYSYCVHVLGMCEQAAFKRLHAARAARRFPMIFDMLADGRLHLSAITVLAPRLTPENASELLGAAVGRSRSQLERWLAERFPQPDVPTRLEPLSPGKVAATGDLEPSQG